MISRQQYKDYNNGNKDFISPYCEDYTCLACKKHVCDWQEGFLCDYCEQWIHRKCARLTKQENKEIESKEEEICYCRMCTKDIFPFHEVSNTQPHKILIKSGRPKNDINKNIEIKSKIKTTTCNVCNKRNKIINKGVLCKTCFSPIHRKCYKIKLSDMILEKINGDGNVRHAQVKSVLSLQQRTRKILKMALIQTSIANAKQLQILI